MEERDRRTEPNTGRPNYWYQQQSRGVYRGYNQPRGGSRGYMILRSLRETGRGGYRGGYRGRGGFPQQSSMPPQEFSPCGQGPMQA